MNSWLLVLTLMNLLLITYIIFNHVHGIKNKGEDNRMTKGLQLLQNKISILQDLSDKTDEQVRKWVHIIEQKSTDVQSQLNKSDEKIIQIETALSKALDVSKIFYEQVPHSEIMERQKTSKYVLAAKLANQGYTADQIANKVDLSTAEIEMITKVNKDQLQFAEEKLPAWVQTHTETTENSVEERFREIDDFKTQMQQLQKMNSIVSANAFDLPRPDMKSMDQIKQQFVDTLSQNSTQIPQTFLDESRKTFNAATTAMVTTDAKTETGKAVRPFEFRKITK